MNSLRVQRNEKKHFSKTRKIVAFLILAVLLIVTACQSNLPSPATEAAPETQPTVQVPTVTPIPPTATPVPPTATSEPTATPTPQPGMFIDGTITSQALTGNLVGDPSERPYVVYVPPSYAEGDKHYPVVYVLHWFTGNERTNLSYAENYQKYILNKGIGQEMIFVFPNADNVFRGSQYLSSVTIGDYETYIARELVAQIDANYRTIPQPESRGITGCSMGGDGSIHLALTFPDVFGVVASMSGTYDYTNDPTIPDAAAGFTYVPEDLDDLNYYWSTVFRLGTIAYISVAAAAAPNPDRPPFYMDMPFEVVDGEGRIVPEVMEKIAAVDVMHDVEAYLQQPLRLRHILLYHGVEDRMAPVELARSFDQLLTARGVEHEYVEIKSRHCNYTEKPILQYLSDHLVGEQP